MELLERRAEESPGVLESLDTALDKEIREHPVDAELDGQAADLFLVGGFLDNPFAVRHSHSIQI